MADDVKRALVYAASLKLGIVPIENPFHDMNKALNQLSPEEARKMKRKFRKEWRKLAKMHARMGCYESILGLGMKSPKKLNFNARKRAVAKNIEVKSVGPILNRIKGNNQ